MTRSLLVLAGLAGFLHAAAPLKTESFDRDPGWEGHQNRLTPKAPVRVKQDFGFSLTNHAGKAKGEVGGVIQRSTTPAIYAAALPEPKTLNDQLSASGSFAITHSQAGAGVFFGFFSSNQPGGSGRPIGSLGLNFDFEAKGGRLAVRLITGGNRSCGTFITPYLPGKYRTTPLKLDGTKYHWTLDYDPGAAQGNGRFTFTLRSDNHPLPVIDPALPAASLAEERARFPTVTSFTVDLPPGYKQENATFDRFGIINMMKGGGTVTMFFDDLTWNGQKQEFSGDPEWAAVGNRVSFEDKEPVGIHQFGFSPDTNHAGGAPGEVGGGFWRSGDFAYYADRVGPLNLEQKLEARGKVRLITAGPDSDMLLGWFNSAAKGGAVKAEERNFVGVHVGGPTRVGHYFIPRFADAAGGLGKVNQGPIIKPGKTLEWSLVYDPEGAGGLGAITVTLAGETVTLPLKKGQKAKGATLDRFGLFTNTAGGQMVKIFFDDLAYTAAMSF
jgi:hypothetical protein